EGVPVYGQAEGRVADARVGQESADLRVIHVGVDEVRAYDQLVFPPPDTGFALDVEVRGEGRRFPGIGPGRPYAGSFPGDRVDTRARIAVVGNGRRIAPGACLREVEPALPFGAEAVLQSRVQGGGSAVARRKPG